MKFAQLKTQRLNNQTTTAAMVITMVVAGVVIASTLGALNGTALTTGVWDALVTTVKGLLTSTWVLALAFIALVASVWQIAHGRGYGTVATILGLLAVALIGPGMAQSIATATHAPTLLIQSADGSYTSQHETSSLTLHTAR